MIKLNEIFVLAALISVAYGFMGFQSNGKSILFREPPLPVQKSIHPIKTEYIEQKLDNFDPQNLKRWDMRYMSNDQHFKPGGPIFIMLGGEWTISEGSIRGGHFYDIAAETNGYLFYTEHRYYGASHPTSDISTDNLKYLTTDQALADVAHFIEHIRATIPGLENSKVVLNGGSYSATMATFFRQKYPHLVVGSWASSAPLLAKVDFYEYKEVVGDAIKLLGGDKCYATIEKGFNEIQKLVENNQIKELNEKLNFCTSFKLDSEVEKWYMMDAISEIYSGIIQYHSGQQMKDACNTIMSTENPIDGVVKHLNQYGCIEANYTRLLEIFNEQSWDSNAASGGRQWLYQTCSAYGFYQSSNSVKQPFGSLFPADLYIQICADLFGKQFSSKQIQENIDRTNVIYGALNPGVTNVFSTHGEVDPWHAMGLRTDYGETCPTVIIPFASHCADMGSLSSWDNEVMQNTKKQIREYFFKWLDIKQN